MIIQTCLKLLDYICYLSSSSHECSMLATHVNKVLRSFKCFLGNLLWYLMGTFQVEGNVHHCSYPKNKSLALSMDGRGYIVFLSYFARGS